MIEIHVFFQLLFLLLRFRYCCRLKSIYLFFATPEIVTTLKKAVN